MNPSLFPNPGKIGVTQQIILYLVLAGLVTGLCASVVQMASHIGNYPYPQQQKYLDVTGVTTLVFSFPEGFDIAPLHGDQNLKWRNGEIQIQEKWEMPFDDSAVLHAIRRTMWSYITKNTSCSSVLGFSASLFNKYDIFLDICGKNIQYKVNERASRLIAASGEFTLMRMNKTRSAIVYTKNDSAGATFGMKFNDQEGTTEVSLPRDQFANANTVKLPLQKSVRLSPLDQFAIVLDHGIHRRLRLINLSGMQVTTIDAPGYSQSQIHFSPIFLNDRKIAFSILDGERWGTVVYDVITQSYKVVSESFSDQLYPLGNGEMLMVQSIFANTGNVPFASKTLQEKRGSIASQEGTLIFVQWNGIDTETLGNIPFAMEEGEDHFEYTRNIGALLEMLGAPDAVVKEYLSRSRFREKDNIPYRLVDWL